MLEESFETQVGLHLEHVRLIQGPLRTGFTVNKIFSVGLVSGSQYHDTYVGNVRNIDTKTYITTGKNQHFSSVVCSSCYVAFMPRGSHWKHNDTLSLKGTLL